MFDEGFGLTVSIKYALSLRMKSTIPTFIDKGLLGLDFWVRPLRGLQQPTGC